MTLGDTSGDLLQNVTLDDNSKEQIKPPKKLKLKKKSKDNVGGANNKPQRIGSSKSRPTERVSQQSTHRGVASS
jgi:hypothetical protein